MLDTETIYGIRWEKVAAKAFNNVPQMNVWLWLWAKNAMHRLKNATVCSLVRFLFTSFVYIQLGFHFVQDSTRSFIHDPMTHTFASATNLVN